MITAVDEYFEKGCGRCERFATTDCSTRPWIDGLLALRRICLDVGLRERAKWGHPCYLHAGRNVTVLGAFRGDFRLSFFNAALMQDPEGLLERQGPHTRHPDMIRFTSVDQVPLRAPVVRAYLLEAMGYAEAGIKPPREVGELDGSDELTEALASDPDLAAAFYALTPGRQRGYVIHLNSAKKVETRRSRLAACRSRILAGKGAMER